MLPNKVQNAQVSDTSGDDSSNTVCKQKFKSIANNHF